MRRPAYCSGWPHEHAAFEHLARARPAQLPPAWGYREPTDEYVASIALRTPPSVLRLIEAGHGDALTRPIGWL
jgi:hypothetical protein